MTDKKSEFTINHSSNLLLSEKSIISPSPITANRINPNK